METAYLRKRKRPSGSGFWGAYVVEQDQHGTWLFTPQGSLYRGERNGIAATCAVGRPEPPGLDVVHLIPARDWWLATWRVDGTVPRIAVDVCTPATRHGSEWDYVDLELDLHKTGDGVSVDDEDEFDQAVRDGVVSEVERRESLAVAARLGARLRAYDEVFDGAGWERLERLAASGLPPITEL